MILNRIKKATKPGTQIPKPRSTEIYTVVRWGKSRGEEALVYQIPAKHGTIKPSEKRVTVSAFRKAFDILQKSGKITRSWFAQEFPKLESDGSCNFTTLGGVFVLIGEAWYARPGEYEKTTTD